MLPRAKLIAGFGALLSFLFCLWGGLWLLTSAGFDHKDPLGTAIGLYFVGKAFFVGPMLYLTMHRPRQE